MGSARKRSCLASGLPESVSLSLRASSSASTSLTAVSVGARCPVADVKAIFTSKSVPTFSPIRRTTCDSFSAITPSERR
eukprot:1876174-Pleurochrysis_carterae.AAC.2